MRNALTRRRISLTVSSIMVGGAGSLPRPRLSATQIAGTAKVAMARVVKRCQEFQRRTCRRPRPLRVVGPGHWQVGATVDQSVPMPAGVGHEYGDLSVLDPPCGAGVLTLDPDAVGPLLQIPGLIGDQYAITITEALHELCSHVVADGVRVPHRPVQQPLHRVRACPACSASCQLLFTLEIGQQAGHEPGRRATRFDPRESARERAQHLIQDLLPASSVYAVAALRPPDRSKVPNEGRRSTLPTLARVSASTRGLR